MLYYKYLLVISFTLFIFYILYIVSKHFKLVDLPEKRKVHDKPIPFIGGLIIFFSIIFSSLFFNYNYHFNFLIYTSSLIIIIGLIDDKYNLSPYTRLFFQFSSSFVMFGSGLIISNLGYYNGIGNINLYIFSYTFTALSIVILINAYNFIDGIDGLCGGMFISNLIIIILYSVNNNNFQINDFSLIYNLIIITSIFLIFNIFSKNFKIFLGDSGSMLLGLLLGWLIIYYTSKEFYFHPVLALWVITYPIFDFLTVFFRRLFYEGKNPMLSDKFHFHHLILSYYNSHKVISLFLNILSLLLGLFGLLIFNLFGSTICLISYLIMFVFYNIIYYRLFRSQNNS